MKYLSDKTFPSKINDFQFSLLTIPHSNAISDWLWRKQREQEGQRGRNSSSQPRRRAIEVVQMADDREGFTQVQPYFCFSFFTSQP